MNPQFQAHGEFKTHVDGHLIVSEVAGPWNKELVEDWAADAFNQLKAAPPAGALVGITIIRGSILCTPEALDALARAVRYGANHLDCIGNCIVAADDVEARSLLEPIYARLYIGVTPYRFFRDFDTARQWAFALLAEKGF
ncbi:hypothetical protein [Massilia glaciei]|uniref:STAS/SEC14 domain-containing protein n=1 Tax=Massilia glaciei TaxID=1524097 RepID=A0A2U2I575_9BURK|nr:hypothetical protein [Massilia glaciei]PWF54940.1 hypothetical protein C7C56_004455 [Massilia glaciei]